jgi:hypothetical protein
MFYVLRYSIALINPGEGNAVLGMMQMFGGSLKLAEAMAPRADCVKVAMDDPEHKELMTELFICSRCLLKPLLLPLLSEKRQHKESDEAADRG